MGPEDCLTSHCKNSFFSLEADEINRLKHVSVVLKQGIYESLCPFSEDRKDSCPLYLHQGTRTSTNTLLCLGIMLVLYGSIK